MKKVIGIVIGLFVLGLLALPKIRPSSSTGQPVQNRQVPVHIYVAESETIHNEIQLPGTILPNEHVQITSEIAGVVKAIHFQEGETVSKGKLLLKIDDSVLQAQKSKTLVQLELAVQRQERGEQQLEIDAISQEEYDVLANTVKALQADLKLLDAQIEKSIIKAPFNGIIGLRQTSPGSYIAPNSLIAHLLDVDPIKIEFAVPGKYAGMVSKNSKITVISQGHDRSFEASVYAVEPQIDPSTRTLKVRAQSPNPGGTVIPGAFATVTLVLETLSNTIMIPSEALIPDLGSSKVFLVKNGLSQMQPVNSGLRFNEKVQIVSGIAAGDTVITSGVLNLRPNAPVTIQPSESKMDQTENQPGLES
jgi:membrane fusion protein (multidrug efflux system)